jgi:hypothetical protein
MESALKNERGMHNKSRMTSGETDIEKSRILSGKMDEAYRHSMPDN